ncbi:MAG: hypothetical protein OHK0026_17960 [Rhodocyclaceae bacterium]
MRHARRRGCRRAQRGAVLVVLLAMLVAAGAYALISRVDATQPRLARERSTAAALALAREALVGRALADDNRPGSLPCPDTDDDGVANTVGGNCTVSYLGRLPWKTLGLPELRDGDGERLWYALSPAFRDNPAAEPINSDTQGLLTLDGAGGIAAIVFAPGPPLAAQAGRPGNRLADYLDGTNADGDEAYASGPPGEAFNDRALPLGRAELMHAVAARVGAEALKCLHEFAAAHAGRYPWAADPGASAAGDYADTAGSRFGRLPEVLANSAASLGEPSLDWPAGCAFGEPSSWWVRSAWRELVFFAVASEAAPDAPPCPLCAGTLAVRNGAANARVVVIVASGMLAGQSRASTTDKGVVSNYLESENASFADGIFERGVPGPNFNDIVAFE